MKKNICKILCTVVFFMVVCVPWSVRADIIYPVWQVGDKWMVKAVYPSSMKKDAWSAPVYWEYNVVACEENGSKNCYAVEVRNHSASLKLTARLMYVKDPPNLFLSRAEITKTRRGKEIVKLLTYNKGIPVRTEQTLIPYDTPVFPLYSPSSADFAATKHITRELRTTDTLRQEIRQVSGTENLPDWPVEKKLTEVKCTTANDETPVFVQYWHKNLPWPVFGWNKNMKYWLVEKK